MWVKARQTFYEHSGTLFEILSCKLTVKFNTVKPIYLRNWQKQVKMMYHFRCPAGSGCGVMLAVWSCRCYEPPRPPTPPPETPQFNCVLCQAATDLVEQGNLLPLTKIWNGDWSQGGGWQPSCSLQRCCSWWSASTRWPWPWRRTSTPACPGSSPALEVRW